MILNFINNVLINRNQITFRPINKNLPFKINNEYKAAYLNMLENEPYSYKMFKEGNYNHIYANDDSKIIDENVLKNSKRNLQNQINIR